MMNKDKEHNERILPRILWVSLACNIINLFILLIIVTSLLNRPLLFLEPILELLFTVLPIIQIFLFGSFGFPLSIGILGTVSLITSILSIRKIKKDSKRFRGKKLALFNLTISIVMLLYYPIMVFYLFRVFGW